MINLHNLSSDHARCRGTRCPERDDCARYCQIERDAALPPARRSYVDTLRGDYSVYCVFRIPENRA